LVASTLGTYFSSERFVLPGAELFTVASMLCVALWLWFNFRPTSGITLSFAIAFGIIQGYAYGEAIIGAETTPLVSYLLGLMMVQFAVVVRACLVWTRLSVSTAPGTTVLSRSVSGILASVGFWLLAGFLFAA
jgi:urease accessory protein